MQILSTTRKFRDQPKPDYQIRRKSQKKQSKICSCGASADGFLKQQFLPLFESGKVLPEKEPAQKQFLESLEVLKNTYKVKTLEFENKLYPFNILLTHYYMQIELEQIEQDIELSIVKDDKNTVKLLTETVYNTGTILYDIPVVPLYRLLQDKKKNDVPNCFYWFLPIFLKLQVFRITGNTIVNWRIITTGLKIGLPRQKRNKMRKSWKMRTRQKC